MAAPMPCGGDAFAPDSLTVALGGDLRGCLWCDKYAGTTVRGKCMGIMGYGLLPADLTPADAADAEAEDAAA
ncbi:MAG: hypothetical protein JXA87_02155 [Thermoleophilia bacterium]|nr:hypothetical protein [Thermoleophilia bacterium]